jgi:hypothetical protein
MRKGSDRVRPWCPFCGQDVGKPVEPVNRKMDEFLLGECQCGAVYTSDPTGFNVGSAMVECMVAACDDNSDLAFDLDPEEDYLSDRIDHYNEVDHYVYESGTTDGRMIRGVLYFIRLNKDVANLSKNIDGHKKQKAEKIQATAISSFIPPEMEDLPETKGKQPRVKKQEIDKWVKDGNIDALVQAAMDNSRTIRFIQRLLYDPSEDGRYQIAYIMGQVCRRISTRKPGHVSDLLHRMYESATDSAATHWGVFEAVGYVIAMRADIFGAFARHLLVHRNTEDSRAVMLWALGTIAENSPEVIRATPIYAVFDMINHEEALTRGLAVRLFGRINAMEVRSQIESLVDDDATLTVYEKGLPQKTTVGTLAKEALTTMGTMGKNAKAAPMTLGNAL